MQADLASHHSASASTERKGTEELHLGTVAIAIGMEVDEC